MDTNTKSEKLNHRLACLREEEEMLESKLKHFEATEQCSETKLRKKEILRRLCGVRIRMKCLKKNNDVKGITDSSPVDKIPFVLKLLNVVKEREQQRTESIILEDREKSPLHEEKEIRPLDHEISILSSSGYSDQNQPLNIENLENEGLSKSVEDGKISNNSRFTKIKESLSCVTVKKIDNIIPSLMSLELNNTSAVISHKRRKSRRRPFRRGAPKAWMKCYDPPVNCVTCNRELQPIRCLNPACGYEFMGRLSRWCELHPNSCYLMDHKKVCPSCKREQLAEVDQIKDEVDMGGSRHGMGGVCSNSPIISKCRGRGSFIKGSKPNQFE